MVKYIACITIFIIIEPSIFAQNILYDDESDYHSIGGVNYWENQIDTLETYGITVHYTSIEGWSNIMNMDMVWIQSPADGDYYSVNEKMILQDYVRNGGRILIGTARDVIVCNDELNDFLEDIGWNTTMMLFSEPDYYNRGVFCSLFVEVSPFTDGVNGILLFAPHIISCGYNCFPFAFADSDVNRPVAAISYPFLNEGNCSSYVVLISGNHYWEDGGDLELGAGDTYIFARNIFLTLCGVPGYEFDPCAFADSVFPQRWEQNCSLSPNPFTPNGDGMNDYCQFTFDGIGEREATIYIHDMYSREVKRINVPAGATAKWVARWDGRDDKGNPLPPGIYLYTIESIGEKVCEGSVVIAR